MMSCLSIIDQAKVTPLKRMLSDSPWTAPGAKSGAYDCLAVLYYCLISLLLNLVLLFYLLLLLINVKKTLKFNK